MAVRIPVQFSAQLSYQTEDGDTKQIIGRVLNMSASGALVKSSKPLPVATEVRVRANELLVGTAYVRHAVRGGLRFRIGLEFAKAIPNRY